MTVAVTKKQLAFLKADATEVLFGGAAGGGKSYGQLVDALRYAVRYPRSKQLILRRTYAELDKLLEGFEFLELDRRMSLPDSFITPFVNAGAFYTLKNAIMFENKRIYRYDCAGSLKALNEYAKLTPNGAMDLYRMQA